jgi:uncharacterized LabA/DUF88 family protein
MSSNAVRKKICGVFMDGSNLFSGQKDNFWIDFEKLKVYLKKAYKPAFYNYYGGIDTSPSNEVFKEKADSQVRFYNKLGGHGYNVKTKPLKYIKTEKGIKTKCDMDIDIVLDINDVIENIDVIVLFTGDSDFLSYIEQIHKKGKFIRIYSFKSMLSWELKEFAIKNLRCNYKCIDELKDKIEFNKPIDTKEEKA